MPPHRHYNKSESFHVVEGEVDIVLFDDISGALKVIRMGACGSGKSFSSFDLVSLPHFAYSLGDAVDKRDYIRAV